MRDGPVLEVDDLHVEFRSGGDVVPAVNGMSFHVHPGETLAILGESGSGKTVTASAVMGLVDSTTAHIPRGHVWFEGQDLLTASARARRQVRGEGLSMIFQDALTALNPVYSVGFQISEILRKRRGMSRGDARKRTIELLERVRIPQPGERVDAYPHQFSGGMRQRVMIAMAVALEPRVLIADEPTTALDVTVQAQIMDLLTDLQQATGMALVLVTHDLGLVAEVADRVAVVYAGRVVEEGDVGSVFRHPAHPYTLGLLASIPRSDVDQPSLVPISGAPPRPGHHPPGCEFGPRCRFSEPRCVEERPPLMPSGSDRASACFFWGEVINEAR